MEARSLASAADGGLAGVEDASRWAGMLVGDVRSATDPWARENPVIAPQVLRLTSAVACCNRCFLAACTTSPPRGRIASIVMAGSGYPCGDRLLRIACTCGLPGSFAFSNSTAASRASAAGSPTNHARHTSATSAAWPAALVTGWAHRLGYPARDTIAADPVYRAQLAGLLPSPGWTAGLPLALVSVAPPMMLLMARAATARLSIGS